MALFDKKKYNFSKLDDKEQVALSNVLENIKKLVNSRALLYRPQDNKVIIRNVCYGTLDPIDPKNTVTKSPVEGQIYFHIRDSNN